MVSRRFVVLLVLICSVVLDTNAAPKAEFAGLDRKWQRYESPNFELYSHVSDSKSRQFLRRLELLRSFFSEMVRSREQRPNLVTVYCFGDVDDFLAYVPLAMRSEDRLAAFYLAGIDRSVIVVSPVRDDDDAQRIIFHEYVHHLSRVNGDQAALWYTEGIAEFLSTIREDGKFLSVGLPIEEHVAFMRQTKLLPLESLFSVDHSSRNYNEAERAGVFYAESWAMFHYWYSGQNRATPAQLAARDRFFRLVRNETENGDPVKRRQLFEEFAQMNYAEMVRTLQTYVRDGRYTWHHVPLPQIPPLETYRSAPVDWVEMRRRLAELDLRVNRSPLAKLAMLDACSQQPTDVRAHEILAAEAMKDGDLLQAKERWEQAVEAGTKNPSVFHELAALEGEQWFSRLDFDFELPLATADHLRQLLYQSIQSVPSQTQAYEILAWVEATVKKPSPKNINLVQQQLPSLKTRSRTLLALALVRIKLGDNATAGVMLDQVDKEAETKTATEWSAQIRRYLKRRENAPAKTPDAD
jgi:hypothetical protein